MGMFFTQNNKPYFSPSGAVEDGYEIVTSKTPGAPISVVANPVELLPNIYNVLGTVNKKVKIVRLISLSKDYVETYSGEFTIGRGSVEFPSTVRWEKDPDFSEEGYTYQFEIKNGIGRYIKVR